MLILLSLHYIFDFLFQAQEIRERKSKNLKEFFTHIAIYTLGLFIMASILSLPIEWIIINGILHYGIDLITSTVSSYYFQKENIWAGMNVVGIDQILHIASLYFTYILYI